MTRPDTRRPRRSAAGGLAETRIRDVAVDQGERLRFGVVAAAVRESSHGLPGPVHRWGGGARALAGRPSTGPAWFIRQLGGWLAVGPPLPWRALIHLESVLKLLRPPKPFLPASRRKIT